MARIFLVGMVLRDGLPSGHDPDIAGRFQKEGGRKMQVDFVIDSWAAFAPGMASAGQWENWAAAPCWPRLDAAPALAPVAGMPALLRRRLGPRGRMAADRKSVG